jgi:hypothetical protein
VSVALLVLIAGLFVSALPASAQSVGTHSTVLGPPRVDVLPDGKVVINADTFGEFKGLLTLNLSTNDQGVLAGEWVLSVRYTDNTDPATGLEPPAHSEETAEQHENDSAAGDEAHPHRDYARYIDKGVLGGPVESAAVAFDADGNLSDFSAVLKISVGTLTFEGVSGSGVADLVRGIALVF